MDLVFRTLRGSIQMNGLMDSLSIGEIKQLLHQQHKEEPLAVPEPQLQRLVRPRPRAPLHARACASARACARVRGPGAEALWQPRHSPRPRPATRRHTTATPAGVQRARPEERQRHAI